MPQWASQAHSALGLSDPERTCLLREAAAGLPQHAQVPWTSWAARVEMSVLTCRAKLAHAPDALSHQAVFMVHVRLGERAETCSPLWHRGRQVPLRLEVSEGEETGKGDFPGTMCLKGYARVRVWWGCPSIPLLPSLQTPRVGSNCTEHFVRQCKRPKECTDPGSWQ